MLSTDTVAELGKKLTVFNTLTVASQVAVKPLEATVIVAVPGPIAVTTPIWSTAKIESSELLHTGERSTIASNGFLATPSWKLSPAYILPVGVPVITIPSSSTLIVTG